MNKWFLLLLTISLSNQNAQATSLCKFIRSILTKCIHLPNESEEFESQPTTRLPQFIIIERSKNQGKSLIRNQNKKQVWESIIVSNNNECINVIDEGVRKLPVDLPKNAAGREQRWRIESNKPGKALLRLVCTEKGKFVEQQLVNVTVTD